MLAFVYSHHVRGRRGGGGGGGGGGEGVCLDSKMCSIMLRKFVLGLVVFTFYSVL